MFTTTLVLALTVSQPTPVNRAYDWQPNSVHSLAADGTTIENEDVYTLQNAAGTANDVYVFCDMGDGEPDEIYYPPPGSVISFLVLANSTQSGDMRKLEFYASTGQVAPESGDGWADMGFAGSQPAPASFGINDGAGAEENLFFELSYDKFVEGDTVGLVFQEATANQNHYDIRSDSIRFSYVVQRTWFGDANLDGVFNSSDLVLVNQAGLYESGMPATWAEGDWNGDGFFDSADYVLAGQDGGYVE